MHRKFYLLLLSFIFVTLTLSTTVFAWFQLSRTNMIEAIEIGIALDDNIELSLDGLTYHKTIDNEMLTSIIGQNPKLASITSQDGVNFFKGPFETTTRATRNVDYISFPLYFRLTSDNPNEDAHQKYIYLANRINPTYDQAPGLKGTFVTSRGNNWTNNIPFENGTGIIPAGTNRLYYASHAVRISNESPNPDHRFIYDVSEDRYRGFGKIFGAYDYFRRSLGVELTIPEPPENEIFRLSRFSALQNDIAIDKDSLLAQLDLISQDNGIYIYQGMTRINIWLEGWDADAFDPILDDRLLISLSIRSARFDETHNIDS